MCFICLDVTLCMSQTSGGREFRVCMNYFLALWAFHPAVLPQQVALILLRVLKCLKLKKQKLQLDPETYSSKTLNLIVQS